MVALVPLHEKFFNSGNEVSEFTTGVRLSTGIQFKTDGETSTATRTHINGVGLETPKLEAPTQGLSLSVPGNN